MNAQTPPPLTEGTARRQNWRSNSLIGICVVAGIFVVTLFALRVFGLLQPFSVPTGAMTPAVSPGDHIMMEGLTYLARKPKRGDVVVFKSDGISKLPPATFYVKRVIGEPGDRVRIADGQLYINDARVTLSNAYGEISFALPSPPVPQPPLTNVTIPAGNYFVHGDNSTNSFDSRYWGLLPYKNIKGRVWFCYWPPTRAGTIK